jgi:hypothetical protein
MLRSGLILFFISTVGVSLRALEIVVFDGPAFKLICSLALLASVSCLLGTYCLTEFAHNKTRK